MDMEMKKNLAIMIGRGAESPTTIMNENDVLAVLNFLDEKGFLQEPRETFQKEMDEWLKNTAEGQKSRMWDVWMNIINAEAKTPPAPEPTSPVIHQITYPETHDDFSTFMSALNALVQRFTRALDQAQVIILLRTEANLIEYAEEQGRILRGED